MPEEARAATVMNEKVLDNNHRLVALISDPGAKKSRTGALSEGRELFVGNVDHGATDEEIKELFSQYGTIESLRRPKSMNGNFKGSCFVVYSTSEEATSALALNNKPLKARLLRVTLATSKGSVATQSDAKVIRASAEPDDSQSPGAEARGRRGSAVSTASAADGLDASTAYTRRERTVAVLNLPDTVNDSRVQSHLSQYGPLRKITMKHDRNGAMVEFVNLQDAGKVGLGVDCSALGSNVSIGQVSELFGDKEKKNGAAPKFSVAPVMRPAQASVARPGQPGRRGGRGGLGFKRGGVGSGASRPTFTDDGNKMDEAEDGGAAKKGNAEFRALFEKSREDAAAPHNGAGDV